MLFPESVALSALSALWGANPMFMRVQKCKQSAESANPCILSKKPGIRMPAGWEGPLRRALFQNAAGPGLPGRRGQVNGRQ